MAAPAANTTMYASAASSLRHEQMVNPANGRAYELLVSQPQKPAPAQGYAAIFLFDGNRTAPAALAWLRAHDLADRVLVVGLGYPDTEEFNVSRRYEDLTPTAVIERPGTGEAAFFLDFIETQVKPHIARQYRLDPDRTALYGHSLGGLTVLFELVRDPTRFSAYLAASPSLWWDQNSLMPRLRAATKSDWCETGDRRDVGITVGRKEQPLDAADEPDPERRAKLARRHMVDRAAKAAQILAGCKAFDVHYQVLAGADHGAMLDAGLFHALTRWLGTDSTAGRSP